MKFLKLFFILAFPLSILGGSKKIKEIKKEKRKGSLFRNLPYEINEQILKFIGSSDGKSDNNLTTYMWACMRPVSKSWNKFILEQLTEQPFTFFKVGRLDNRAFINYKSGSIRYYNPYNRLYLLEGQSDKTQFPIFMKNNDLVVFHRSEICAKAPIVYIQGIQKFMPSYFVQKNSDIIKQITQHFSSAAYDADEKKITLSFFEKDNGPKIFIQSSPHKISVKADLLNGNVTLEDQKKLEKTTFLVSPVLENVISTGPTNIAVEPIQRRHTSCVIL